MITTSSPSLLTAGTFALDPDQQAFLNNFLKWLADPYADKFGVLQGVGGSGKTATIWHSCHVAIKQGILNGSIAGLGPTHTARKQLKKSADKFFEYAPEYPGWLEERVWYGTLHSALKLIPQEERFTTEDQKNLEKLLSIKEEERTIDIVRRISQYQFRKEAAANQELIFCQTVGGCDFGNTQLVLVDECSMVSQDIFYHLTNLHSKVERTFYIDPATGCVYTSKDNFDAEGDTFVKEVRLVDQIRPDAKVLFMGDAFQLPPVREKISKTFEIDPYLGNFTKVHRNSGSVRQYALSIRECSNPYQLAQLHHPFLKQDQAEVLELSYRDAMWGGADLLANGEEVVFIAATNEKVESINRFIRKKLYGAEFDYRPGDRLLTRRPVRRGGLQSTGPFANAKQGKPLSHTSTLVNLVRPVEVGEWAATKLNGVKYSDFQVRLEPQHFKFTAPTGTTYCREFWRYKFDDTEDNPKNDQCLILLDPNQREQYLADLEHLRKLMGAFYSRGQKKTTARGQNGEYAKLVWEMYDLKNWFKFKDGTEVEADVYDNIKREVQQNYYRLLNFVDDIRYSYARTVHSMQGDQVDIVVIDAATVFPKNGMRYSNENWDYIRTTYTAASRAVQQIVIAA
ncbi:MAG: AAA family ATPase [Cyanobacteria bacterium P01_H01_bin.105]